MAKQTKWLAVAAVTVALLGGAAFWLAQTPTTEEQNASQEEKILLADRTLQEISQVRMTGSQGEYTLENTGESNFSIEALGEAPVNETQLDLLLNCVQAPQVSRVVSQQPEDLEQYGLSEPQAQVEIRYTDDSSLTLLLGGEAPQSAGVYLKTGDGDTVYLMDSDWAETLSWPLEQLVNRTLGEGLSADEVGTVTLSGGELTQTVVLEPLEDGDSDSYPAVTHTMTQPEEQPANSETVSTILTTAMGLTASSADTINPTAEEMSQAGFDNPTAVLTMAYKDGEGSLTLRAGKVEDGQVWVMKGGVPVIYVIPVDSCPWVSVTYDQLISPKFADLELDELSEISVVTADETYLFTMDGEGENLTVSANGQQLDSQEFQDYFNSIIVMEGETYTTQQPSGSPWITLTYTYRDTALAPVVITMTPWEESYLVTVNGRTQWSVSANIPQQLLENTQQAAQSLAETETE